MKSLRVFAYGLALLLVVLMAAYFALNAWIGSAGGRGTIEKQLSDAAGTPVRLSGEFEVAFWPPVGASGTDLEVWDSEDGTTMARAREFEIELALGPLLKRQLFVERVQLQWLTLGAPGGVRFAFPRVEITGFAPGAVTGLDIDLGFLGTLNGVFTWRPEAASVDLDIRWAAEQRADIEVIGSLHYAGSVVRVTGLSATIGGQQIAGEGCVLLDEPTLNLQLVADTLDLEALADGIPGGPGASSGALPMDINLRLEANTLLRGDLEARETVLEVGGPPACP